MRSGASRSPSSRRTSTSPRSDLTPYAGKILWTVETDHVIAAEWKDVTRGDAKWSFTLPEFAPNVYISAFRSDAVRRQDPVDGRDRSRDRGRVEGRHPRRCEVELHAPRVRAERLHLRVQI